MSATRADTFTSELKSARELQSETASGISQYVPKLRWLDWIFWEGYLPSLSVNYVAMSKDMGKRLPQLYYIKIKISFDLGFIAIRVAMAT